jgi:predicted Zn-dependent protease
MAYFDFQRPRGIISLLLVVSLFIVSFSPRMVQARAKQYSASVSTNRSEVYAGAHLDRIVREKFPDPTNAGIQQYVSSVGLKIASVSHKNIPLTYTVLEDPRQALSFSSPGGFVYITTGLLNMMESESQLAGVLAHETGHVMQHHTAHRVQDQFPEEFRLMASGAPLSNNVYSALSRVGDMIINLQFDTWEDDEADKLAVRMMAEAGYNPNALSSILEKINKMSTLGVVISYQQQHPAHETRVLLLNEYIYRNQLHQANQIKDTPQFHRFIR